MTPTNSKPGSPPLEQQFADLRVRFEERSEELDTARAANRELMAQLNRPDPGAGVTGTRVRS
ncbi:hypothetical protein [Nocardia pseudovaccinii]|uniref:hypothetical protein n=1 Tax=Nocardia pseudovaccinii TaxID=189540 RepID=UPI000AB1E6C0|nr:hypothetical protein [Nocardia pseudovaccinii]